MALEAVLELHRAGYSFVLDADIKGFFDNRSHQIILQNVAERVADGNILPLVEKLLPSGVMDNGVFKPTTIGTPPGGLVSPRLATLVLNHLIGNWTASAFALFVMPTISWFSPQLQNRPKSHGLGWSRYGMAGSDSN